MLLADLTDLIQLHCLTGKIHRNDSFCLLRDMAADALRVDVVGVTLYISTGPKSVTVPSFVGEDIAIAIKDAQDMGLTVGQPAFDPYTEVETGRITDQSIQPGEVVDGGTQIVFTVSGTGEEDIVTRTKTVEFSLPEDMDGMIKVEFEQDARSWTASTSALT